MILSLGNNNPLNSSKLASLLKSKETMEECVKLVVSHKVSETLGQSMTRDVIIVDDDTEIIDNSVDLMSATKNGESLTLYRVDANDYKNKFGVKLSDTPNTNSKWYVDERGRMFLVYDFIENVPEFMKESDTTLNKSVESFVIITGQELENSIIESAEITIPEETVGIGEDKNLTVNLSNVKNLSYCKWVINTSNTKLGTEDETKYPNMLDSNNAEISLSSITEPGNYYLHMLIVTTTNQKVEKISSKIIVEKKSDVWDGSVATSFASGTGTEQDPYIIETVSQFAYFANCDDSFENKYIKVISDLDFNNYQLEPVGYKTSQKTFSGNFDGNKHKFLNINCKAVGGGSYAYSGLFFISNGDIKNIIVESGNIAIEIPHLCVGSIVGQQTGGNISNCSNNVQFGTDTYVYGNRVGGIVGASSAGNINACVNYSNIEFKNASLDYLGGIIGYAESSQTIISNCYNRGNISSGESASGIVGSSNCKVINSYNTGNMTSYQGASAGMVSSGTVIVEDCYNIGIMLNTHTNRTAGGIVGDSGSSQIRRCYSTGNVTGNAAGGIIGNVGYNCSVKLENNYYLSGSAVRGFGCQRGYQGSYNSVADSIGKVESLEADNMPSILSVVNKDNEFIEDATNINDGYPVLKWQVE